MLYFSAVQRLFVHNNSIQHMTGYGLFVYNSDNAIISNCSFYMYYSAGLCTLDSTNRGGGLGIVYDTQYSKTGYTLELSYSNLTKCCNLVGGGIFLQIRSGFGSATVALSNLVLSKNSAKYSSGGLAAIVYGDGTLTLAISNRVFSPMDMRDRPVVEHILMSLLNQKSQSKTQSLQQMSMNLLVNYFIKPPDKVHCL